MSTRHLRRLLVVLAVVALPVGPAWGTSGTARPAHHTAARPHPARWFFVGAAKQDITPRRLDGVYLGGYGIGPVHPAKGVLRPIYVRALAVRDSDGDQSVIATLDVQGHFLAYRNGPYGFADMAADLHRQLGIPVASMLFLTTHTHNGPDDLGVWGGVPTSYLALVKQRTERAVRQAVRHERRATLRWSSADMTGFNGTFAAGDHDDGDTTDYPVDSTMRVLQASDVHHHVIATMLNFASHATVYGPLDKVSPDWPGAAATYLEHDEHGLPGSRHYGYPHSVAVVTEGDLGHSWPAGIPRHDTPRLNPRKASDANYPADRYGNAVARSAIAALRRHARRVVGPVRATWRPIVVANDNPVLLAGLANPVQGVQVYRSVTPPYGAGDALVSKVAAVRIGQLLLAGAPGEEYPAVNAALAKDVRQATVVPLSLADDQLGYLGTPADYVTAQQCSLTDEGFFTISPSFGDQVLQAQRQDAAALGLTVAGSDGLTETGSLPVSGVCLASQLPAAP